MAFTFFPARSFNTRGLVVLTLSYALLLAAGIYAIQCIVLLVNLFPESAKILIPLLMVLSIGAGFVFSARARSLKANRNREQLSPREEEVLQQLLTGRRNKEICETLFISHSTLKTHINRIYKKTGTNNRRALMQRGFQNMN